MSGERFPEPVEATPAQAIEIARQYLHKALEDIRSDGTHADVWINDALVWLPNLGQRRTFTEAHENTMIGRLNA